MCLIAAADWSTLLWWIDVIFKVSVGLGAVIFVHELGHFLVAKACGVKIEKFMIGFDIGGYKLSWRRGETVYGIGILPLGGYVKMLGQDDDPAHIAEQMQKSQVNAASADAVPITGPNGETYYIDRRSYLAKSVPQRMAIISAGVVMNVIFAFIFAVIAFGMGVPNMPAIVSETVAGSPAWQAGIEPGDEIVQIGQRTNPTFVQLVGGVTLGDLENGIPLLVRRAADDKVVDITLKPTQVAGELATVGITSPLTLTLRKELPVLEDSAASQAKLVGKSADEIDGKPQLQSGDTIVRVGDVQVKNYREFSAELARAPGDPLSITVERPANTAGTGLETSDKSAGKAQELVFEVPPQRLRDFGLIMRMGPISAVQVNSPAAEAGIEAGDIIELVDGRPISDGTADSEGWTPFSLPDYLRQAAIDGRQVELTVLRNSRERSDDERVIARVSPAVPIGIHSGIPMGASLGADAIGIAYRIDNVVHAVVPGSSAASADIAAHDQIVKARIQMPADDDGKLPEPAPIELGPGQSNWPALIDKIQFAPSGTKVELSILRGKGSEPHKVVLSPEPTEDMFIAARGFLFEPLMRIRKAATFTEQIRYGFDETVDSLTMVFRFLQKLGTQQVPITMLGGPGTIAVAAGASASQGLSSLLIFLTVLSANLAVLNFLPIPLLDGGHMVFLAYEGLRGRPASERFVLALHTAGFVFIIGLMVFVIGLDIQRWLLT